MTRKSYNAYTAEYLRAMKGLYGIPVAIEGESDEKYLERHYARMESAPDEVDRIRDYQDIRG